MSNYILDTDIIFFHLQGQSEINHKIQAVLQGGRSLAMSLITYLEVVRGFKIRNLPHKESQFRRLAQDWGLYPLDIEVMDIAASIYADLHQHGKLIPDADLLIAASALRFNRILVTNNTKHFSRIPKLALENWVK